MEPMPLSSVLSAAETQKSCTHKILFKKVKDQAHVFLCGEQNFLHVTEVALAGRFLSLLCWSASGSSGSSKGCPTCGAPAEML